MTIISMFSITQLLVGNLLSESRMGLKQAQRPSYTLGIAVAPLFIVDPFDSTATNLSIAEDLPAIIARSYPSHMTVGQCFLKSEKRKLQNGFQPSL